MTARAFRLIGGLPLIAAVAYAATLPVVPAWTAAAAGVATLLGVFRPDLGLIFVAVLVPAGLLLGPSPTQAATMIAWGLLGGWLLALRRPLGRLEWPRGLSMTVALYTACVIGSWVAVTLRDMTGVARSTVPLVATETILLDHLAFTSSDSATSTLLLALTGLGLFAAASALVRSDSRLQHRLAAALVGSMTLLAIATMVAIGLDWARLDFGTWFLERFLRSERYALHLPDLNAAGSQYVLAILIAVTLAVTAPDRWRWVALCLLMLPAAWVTGSRTAAVAAGLVGLAVVAIARGRWKPSRAQIAGLVTAALVVTVASGIVMSREIDERGTAGRAMWLRGQFLATSARMFAAAPLSGVGIGQYHSYSGDFMPERLRAIYPNENAHNYFAQQLAELGVLGGLAFAALAVTLVIGMFRQHGELLSPPGLALAAATLGFLVTCLTGHPLLVAEAALPFWIAAGAAIGSAPAAVRVPVGRHAVLMASAVILLFAAAPSAPAVRNAASLPVSYGLSPPEKSADGTRFQWTARHTVEYVPAASGFLTIRVRAPEVRLPRPFELEVTVDGRPVAARVIPADDWTRLEIPLRQRGSARYVRVDLRLNQDWLPPSPPGTRAVRERRGIMLSELHLAR